MSKNPIVLFRKELDTENEFSICSNAMKTTEFRTQIPAGSLVIGRYSVLPFYSELERELLLSNSKIINSYSQHLWVADIMEWGGENGTLSDLTPRTWSNWRSLPEGPYVIKGKTNSRKFRWNTHMFAPTRADIPRIASKLLDDEMIQQQGLVVREYIPLKKLGEGLNGLPVTNEWRTFWIKRGQQVHLITKGFYWQGTHPELESCANFTEDARILAFKAANLVSQFVNFFVLDLAETETGKWIVVEVNDGQMSGLCGCNANFFYQALHTLV